MYVPEAFRESHLETLHAFLRRYSFATLVSQIDGEPWATHLPLLLDAARGTHGTLLGHIARANPHGRAIEGETQTLAIFTGPHTYVSPSWYATTVAVPTWNYTAVHVYGRLRAIKNAMTLHDLIEQTVQAYEGDRIAPWTMARLPTEATDALLRNVVGFEIEIERIEGKMKLSQNRSVGDRQGVVAALRRESDPDGLSVAALMEKTLVKADG